MKTYFNSNQLTLRFQKEKAYSMNYAMDCGFIPKNSRDSLAKTRLKGYVLIAAVELQSDGSDFKRGKKKRGPATGTVLRPAVPLLILTGASLDDDFGRGLTWELHGNEGNLKAISSRSFTRPGIARGWRTSRFGGRCLPARFGNRPHDTARERERKKELRGIIGSMRCSAYGCWRPWRNRG